MRIPATLAALVAVWNLAGCMVVGPDFAPPSLDLPAEYTASVPASFGEAAPDGPYWSRFGDPALELLVRYGLDANPEIRIAESRLREARAIARGVDAATGPSVDAGADASGQWRRTEEDGEAETGLEGALIGALGVAWEVDLFGGLARSREAAWAAAESVEALGRESERVIAAEIARTYVELRTAERRLALTQSALEFQRRTLALVDERLSAGLSRRLDGVRAEAEVASLEADIAPLRVAAERLRNALAVLLGEPPGTLREAMRPVVSGIPQLETGTPVGVPADIVRRRADVQAAELRIAAATAEVGVAIADLYPRLNLPGTLSAGVTGLGTDTVVTTVLASVSALADVPLYDGGRRRAAVSAAEERVVQAGLVYRSVVLNALREVEAALVGYTGARERYAALRIAVRNNREAYEQSQALYRQGLANFIDVLDSQRQLNDLLQDLALAERDLSLEAINLYAAIGDGREDP